MHLFSGVMGSDCSPIIDSIVKFILTDFCIPINSRLVIFYLSPHEKVTIEFKELEEVFENNGLEILNFERIHGGGPYTQSYFVEARMGDCS